MRDFEGPLLDHGGKQTVLGRALALVREHVSHTFVVGLILLLTGATPEAWLEKIFHQFHLPAGLIGYWPPGFDPRLAVVLLGVAIIVGDTLWRRHAAALSQAASRPTAFGPSPRVEEGPALPEKPSIAVLPFANISGDQLTETYFIDGIVDDLITALSRFPELFVIARNSVFTYQGRVVDVKQVGRELGVRYILEGSVRKSSDRVRISAHLVDAAGGTQIWAERFESKLQDLFELQDEVTARVVAAIAPRLEHAEIARAKNKPTARLDAYDFYLRATEQLYAYSPAGNEEALRLARKAIEIDPDFAAAYGIGAWAYVQRSTNGWIVDREREVADALRLARKAVELGTNDASALARGGHALAIFSTDVEAGSAYCERALKLNPNWAPACFSAGYMSQFLGDQEAALDRFARVTRLSPLDPLTPGIRSGVAFSLFLLDRYPEAIAICNEVLREWPDFWMALRAAAAANALSGQLDIARAQATKLYARDPTFRLSTAGSRPPLRRASDKEKYISALRIAGLPD